MNHSINEISFKSLGITVLKVSNRHYRPSPKEASYIAYEQEGYQVTKAGPRILSLSGLIVQPNYSAFQSKLDELYGILASSGTKVIELTENDLREVFNEEGYKVTQVRVTSGKVTALLALPLTEVNFKAVDYIQQVDGEYVLTVENQKIRNLI